MRRIAALLAAILVSAGVAGCGGGGAEPGASREATLVLDFQPNAAHVGIYAALHEGYYRQAGVDLTVREPSASTDGPKLLEAGRTQFAILDIHDLAIARERGLDVVGVAPIVNRPLAAVIAADRDEVQRPRDLEGQTVGVTGLPSDDAVLDSVLRADGADPAAVDRVTIGFQAVSALAARKVDAATAFWNAEGVTLRRQDVPIRVFKVDRYGAPRYPELVLCTTERLVSDDPRSVESVVAATTRGYVLAAGSPGRALNDLLAGDPGLDRSDQAAELHALNEALSFVPAGRFDIKGLLRWREWEAAHGIVRQPPRVTRTFELPKEQLARQAIR
jgi:NitT/TauT family transport system substrate-binding protein/putative hydroxymethylpyrimidine transport system substrate-binding protein